VTVRVVVWNMQGKTENWAKLAELDADVALLCEARVADYASSDHLSG
jgi:hypothetical protein